MRTSRHLSVTSAASLHKALAGVLGCALAAGAFANPTGMQVVAGQVSTVTSGNQLLITNSPGAILNWQSFSIMPGELTRFIQQSSSSSVLNRITGQDPSQILGALQSNGKVFLINPNGIVFGSGARVDVNGLVASSLDLSNGDFLSGKLKFSGAATAGSVTNYGGITTPSGGQVYLIAPNVTNSGLITSPSGDVMLAAGHSVDLADSNDPDLRVVISAPGDQALNVGKVLADSGRIGVYGALVKQLGLVSANTAVAGETGKIVFKASDTTLLGAGSVTTAQGTGTAQGAATGGEIQALGNRVGLTGDAVVDASGQSGGGTVLVGGDTHGNNPSIQNALLTYVGPQAQINANAIESGEGGKVVVWSDRQTQMYGSISVRGGAVAGNGGFVETSSESKLDFQGQVDLRAPAGSAGTLLLDPSDVLISAAPTSGDVTLLSSAPFTIAGSNASSVLSVTDLQNELGLGNVTVTTSSSASGPLGGTITVAAPLTWSNSNSLTLAADQSIYINAPITASSATLLLSAANGNIVQAINSSAPAVISVASLAASAPNGSVSLTEPTNSISGAVAGVGAHGFSLVNSGTITVGTVGSTVGITSSNGTVSVTAAGDITQSSGPIAAAALSAVATNGSVELSDPNNSVGVVAGSSNGIVGFELNNGGSVSVGSVSGVGVATVNGISVTGAQGYGVVLETQSGGDITVSAPVNAGTAQAVIEAAGAVNQGSGGLITAGGARIYANGGAGIGGSSAPLLLNVRELLDAETASGPVHISNSGNLVVDYVSAGGAVGLRAGGSLTTGTPQTCDCVLSITGSSVNLTANGLIDIVAGYSVAGTNGVSLYAGYNPSNNTYAGSNNTLSIEGSVSGSSVTLSAGGAINVTGTVTGALTQTPNQYSSGSTQPAPTLSQCIADPSLPGCSAVLPTLAQCVSAPSTPGCSVVLPTLAQCTATPTIAGCSVVLPTLAQCVAAPSTTGCTAVLPTFAQCTATPTAAGCSVVLPTLAECTATPSAAGCSVVLPTLAQCTAAPATPGCSAVLPTVAQCTATPSAAGCGVVLPTLAQCTVAPVTPGCSAVLPTVAQCTATPSAAGCSVVLPTLAQCTAAPITQGCSVVLPTLAQCMSTPTVAGCSAVLPTLAECAATPGIPGCSLVLPTLAQCAQSPGGLGCSAVLPAPLKNAEQILTVDTNGNVTVTLYSLLTAVQNAVGGSPSTGLSTSTPASESDPVEQASNVSINTLNTTNSTVGGGGTGNSAKTNGSGTNAGGNQKKIYCD
jgi:filamentous hemagglutinin family protein